MYTVLEVSQYKLSNRLGSVMNIELEISKPTIIDGIDLPAKVQMGEGIIIEHIGGIVINPDVIFGNNINIYNGVTIGIEKRGRRIGIPTIGNEVWIGANSTIVGNILIGDDVLIAPGTYINFDVPNHSIVMGNPGKVVSRENATEAYVENCVY